MTSVDWSINREPVVVILEPWEYTHAHDVGIKRAVANWSVPDTTEYSEKERQQPNRVANVAAAMCELAVAKYLNQYWSGSAWHRSEHKTHKKIADVGDSVEVRRTVVENGRWVVVRESGNTVPNATVWSAHIDTNDDENRVVKIYGWIPQRVGWLCGVPPSYTDPFNGHSRLYHINNAFDPADYFIADYHDPALHEAMIQAFHAKQRKAAENDKKASAPAIAAT